MSEKIVHLNEEVIKGAAERTCEGKRRRNAKWPAGSRSGEADTSWTL